MQNRIYSKRHRKKKKHIMADAFSFKKSNRKYKKYMVETPSGKTVHFGDTRYKQFKDATGLNLYTHLDHGDEKRRTNFLRRMKAIRNNNRNSKEGSQPLWEDKNSALYYSVNYLW